MPKPRTSETSFVPTHGHTEPTQSATSSPVAAVPCADRPTPRPAVPAPARLWDTACTRAELRWSRSTLREVSRLTSMQPPTSPQRRTGSRRVRVRRVRRRYQAVCADATATAPAASQGLRSRRHRISGTATRAAVPARM